MLRRQKMFLHQRLGFFSSSKEMLEQAGRKHLIAVKLQKQLNCCFKKKKKKLDISIKLTGKRNHFHSSLEKLKMAK